MLRLALYADDAKLSSYAWAAPRLTQAAFTAVVGNDQTVVSEGVALAGSVEELFADHKERFDALVIDNTQRSPATWAEQAAALEKHILVQSAWEGPLEQVQHAIEGCHSSGATLMVGGRLRFLPGVQVVKQSLVAKKLGQAGLLRIHHWKHVGQSEFSWSQLLGEIDLALWFFDGPPEKVYSVSQTHLSAGYAQLHLGFREDGMALIDVAPTGLQEEEYFALSLIGSSGAAYADEHHNMQLVFGDGRTLATKTRQDNLATLAQLQEFTTAIREQRPPAASAEDALAAMKVATAAAACSPEQATKVNGIESLGIKASQSRIQLKFKSPGAKRMFRAAVVSVVKHDYVPRGVASHPRFELTMVTDDENQPDWVHQRNEKFAQEFGIPYVRGVEKALKQHEVDVAVISSEAERHCDLSVRAAQAGLHIVQDKPMSTKLSECDRVVEAVERSGVRFLMWNRNFLPAVLHAHEIIQRGDIGDPYAIHVDFYFAKDAGPPKGTRTEGQGPINWLEAQRAAHIDGSDGGVGHEPMGELKIEGIYPLAYIRMLTGAEVTRVFARTASHFHQLHFDNQVEDLATVTLEMERGIVGSLCIGRIGESSHPDIGEIKIHVLGSQGKAVISEARPEASVYYRGQPTTEYSHRRLAVDNDYLQMENFAHAIDTGGDTILGARASRNIAAVVEAALQSSR